MKYTIATVTAIAGICAAVPLTAESTDDAHKIVCFNPHKSSTFCGDLVQNFDWMSGKKTQSAEATWDTNSKGDIENVKLCFPPEHKKNNEKCYNAKPLEGSALLHSTIAEDFKGKITLVIGNQVFLISTSKDLIDSKEKRDAQAATPPAPTSAAPLTTNVTYPFTGTFQNGTATANTSLGYQISYVTKTVPSYVTYCPSATSFTQNNVVYTVTAPSLVTITSCPCTILSATVVPVGPVSTVSVAPFRINNGTVPQGTSDVSGTGVAVVTATENGPAFGTGVSSVSGNNSNGDVLPTGAGVNNGASNNAVDTSSATATGASSNAANPTTAADSNAGAVGASSTAGSNTAEATNGNVSLFQGAAPGSAIPGTLVAMVTVAVAVAAFFL